MIVYDYEHSRYLAIKQQARIYQGNPPAEVKLPAL